VPGQAIAFGNDLQAAGNTMVAGRERNGKVEVYLAPQ